MSRSARAAVCGATICGTLGLVLAVLPGSAAAACEGSECYTLTVSVQGDPGRGSVSSDDGEIQCGQELNMCTASYDAGETVRLNALWDGDVALFTGWSGECEGVDQQCEFVMTADKSATATFTGLDAQPDLKIARSSDDFVIGENVLNSDGAEQTRTWTAKRGQERVFEATIENDGANGDTFSAHGCGKTRKFKVEYVSPTFGDVTEQMTSEAAYSMTASLAPGDEETIEARIKPTKRAKAGDSLSCLITAASDLDPLKTDAVVAKVTAKG